MNIEFTPINVSALYAAEVLSADELDGREFVAIEVEGEDGSFCVGVSYDDAEQILKALTRIIALKDVPKVYDECDGDDNASD